MNNLGHADFYSYCVKYVPTTELYHYQQAVIKHKAFLKRGYEGAILRLDKPYECKRSYSLQKFKTFHDTEATIVGYEAGKGKREGTLGKFIMQDDDGIEFGCPPGKGFTYKDLADIQDNIHDYIGQVATFTYFERTKAGSYRHPMYKCLRNYE
jgi:DNA ligase-1